MELDPDTLIRAKEVQYKSFVRKTFTHSFLYSYMGHIFIFIVTL